MAKEEETKIDEKTEVEETKEEEKKEEAKTESKDELKDELKDESKDESKVESKDESKDEPKEELKEESKETPIDPDDIPLSQLQKDIKSGKIAAVSIEDDTAERAPTPPPKPPRPLSPFSQAQLTLSEAFPTVESKVVRAVLIASGGRVDPAFNGLLSLTDPDYKLDESQFAPPPTRYPPGQRHHVAPPPPQSLAHASYGQGRPPASRYRQGTQPAVAAATTTTTTATGGEALASQRAAKQASATEAIRNDAAQIEEDEKLARMLAAEFDGSAAAAAHAATGGAAAREARRVRYADTGRGTTYNDPRDKNARRESGGSFRHAVPPSHQRYYDGAYDRFEGDDEDDDDDLYKEGSFFDDDLPQIRDNLTKGFNETRDKVNNWVENFKKKIDGDESTPGLFSNFFGGGAAAATASNSGSYNNGYNNNNNNNNNNDRYGGREGYRGVPAGGRTQRFYDRDPEEVVFNGIDMRNDDEDDADSGPAPRLPRRPEVNKENSGTRARSGSETKWEPLNTVSPVPVSEGSGAIGGKNSEGEGEGEENSGISSSNSSSTKKDQKEEGKLVVVEGKETGEKRGSIGDGSVGEDDDPFFIGDSEDEDEEVDSSKKKSGSK
ncbi:uncharacterized protein SAPINGB_P005071 [Magnusiomyces paraingens]|uniref:CUE domain-containing protein n=1 Tax=Magnusiomyces paraingens TaxID=2606893 RepID=A0A5E8BZD1_9ASCO|nr:uncharacterized protein SAPINGB_P005071 [Saprochaete ingens]VVT56462.1 unnamed protein product [Saprochaete ingens]